MFLQTGYGRIPRTVNISHVRLTAATETASSHNSGLTRSWKVISLAFMASLTKLSTAQLIRMRMTGWILNNELDRIRKQAVSPDTVTMNWTEWDKTRERQDSLYTDPDFNPPSPKLEFTEFSWTIVMTPSVAELAVKVISAVSVTPQAY
jgi:hypothetical protein